MQVKPNFGGWLPKIDTLFGRRVPKWCSFVSGSNFGGRVPKLNTDMNFTISPNSKFSSDFRRPYLLNRNSVFHEFWTRCSWVSLLPTNKVSWHSDIRKMPVHLTSNECAKTIRVVMFEITRFPNKTTKHPSNIIKRMRKIYTRLMYANKNLGYYILPSLKEFRPEIHHNSQGNMSNKLK